ncbi:MAG: Rieske 2Fe-2S domain-containing protein [Granulosicoccus sp.]|nr:Rieske 2Fe-2S domain-containing protein [Granulosicoccus sp.]
MTTKQRSQNSGFQGYHQPIGGEADSELTDTNRGTPCGEYLRRYWQPVAMSSELSDLPMAVELLGEPLVLFRDGSGDIGLLHRHCSHRGASLEYGIIAEHGLICCYHGWHYDIDGTLIRAGSEPVKSPICNKVVHGAYPTAERNGIIFAYLGPPDEMPQLPVYDTENLDSVEAVPFSITTPCNWLQIYENTQDPIHVLHLHARSSGVQFGVASGLDQEIEYKTTPIGMINVQSRKVDDRLWVRSTESILPNGNQTGAIFEEAEKEKYFQRSAVLRWMVPVNNTVTRTIGWRFFSEELDPRGQADRNQVGKEKIDFIGQTEDERPYAERQKQPGDYEAQVSQRPIAVHELENHGSSDAGVIRIRHMLRKQVRALQAGEAPQHPQITGSAISTYIQDSVMPWPKDNNEDETTVLRRAGDRVSQTVIESGHALPAERKKRIQEQCQKLISGS